VLYGYIILYVWFAYVGGDEFIYGTGRKMFSTRLKNIDCKMIYVIFSYIILFGASEYAQKRPHEVSTQINDKSRTMCAFQRCSIFLVVFETNKRVSRFIISWNKYKLFYFWTEFRSYRFLTLKFCPTSVRIDFYRNIIMRIAQKFVRIRFWNNCRSQMYRSKLYSVAHSFTYI